MAESAVEFQSNETVKVIFDVLNNQRVKVTLQYKDKNTKLPVGADRGQTQTNRPCSGRAISAATSPPASEPACKRATWPRCPQPLGWPTRQAADHPAGCSAAPQVTKTVWGAFPLRQNRLCIENVNAISYNDAHVGMQVSAAAGPAEQGVLMRSLAGAMHSAVQQPNHQWNYSAGAAVCCTLLTNPARPAPPRPCRCNSTSTCLPHGTSACCCA